MTTTSLHALTPHLLGLALAAPHALAQEPTLTQIQGPSPVMAPAQEPKGPPLVWAERQAALRQALMPTAHQSEAGIRDAAANLTPLPELDPARKMNQPTWPAAQLESAKGAFVGALAGRPDLAGFGRRVLLAVDAGRGDPMNLTTVATVDGSTPLSAQEQDRLFAVLGSNPFLAEVWNAVATRVADIRGVTPAPAAESLVLATWVAPIPSSLWQHTHAAGRMAEAASRLEAAREQARDNSAVGWGPGDAAAYAALHEDVLVRSERLARSAASVRGADQAIAALTALASLADSPDAWTEGVSPAEALHHATARFAAALGLSRLEIAEQAVLAGEVLQRTRSNIRLTLGVIDATVHEDGVASVPMNWILDAVELVDGVTARLLSGKLDPAMVDRIDRLGVHPAQRPDRLGEYSEARQLRIWMTRAVEQSGQHLTVVGHEPGGEAPLGAVAYALGRLSPKQYPGLFAARMGMGEVAGGLNLPLLLHALRNIDELASGGTEVGVNPADVEAIEKRLAEGETFFRTLTSRGIQRLAGQQQAGADALVRELLGALSETPGSGLRTADWAIEPGRVLEQEAPAKEGAQPLRRIDRIIESLGHDGAPLNRLVRELGMDGTAMRRMMEAFPEGSNAWQELREAVLSMKGEPNYAFVDEAMVRKLLEEVRQYPAYAVDLILAFHDRVRQDQLALLEKIVATGERGAEVIEIGQARRRLARIAKQARDGDREE